MPDWPSSLPQKFLARGYAEQAPNNVLRTSMDQGPDKRRRRASDAPWVFTGLMRLTGTQLEAWHTFYYDTIKETGDFTFPHPRSGSPITVSVANNAESAPPVRAINGNDRYELSLALEWSP